MRLLVEAEKRGEVYAAGESSCNPCETWMDFCDFSHNMAETAILWWNGPTAKISSKNHKRVSRVSRQDPGQVCVPPHAAGVSPGWLVPGAHVPRLVGPG